MTAPNRNEGGKTKTFIASAFVFAVCECLGAYSFEIADGLTGSFRVFVHWISLCCIVAGPFAVWHEMSEGKDSSRKRKRIWFWYIIPCIVNVLVAYVVWHPNEPSPSNPTKSNPVESEANVTLETLGVVRKWQPPELPKGPTMISIHIAGNTLAFPATMLPTNPIAPGMRVPGFPITVPIAPYQKNNCLYVAVKSLLRTNLDTVFINEDLDYPLPPKWDRNYNSNSFEIVAEDGLPVLQIAYLKPNEIQINGIFFISGNYGLVAFGDGFETVSFPIGENDEFFSQRKVWFQYPSKEYLGRRAIQ